MLTCSTYWRAKSQQLHHNDTANAGSKVHAHKFAQAVNSYFEELHQKEQVHTAKIEPLLLVVWACCSESFIHFI